MSVFGNEYAELKKSGLTPEQISKALEEKTALEAKIKQLETDNETQKTTLSTMEGSFNEVKNKLAELEANPRRQDPPKKDGDEPKNFTSYLDDEDKAFDDRFKDRAAGLAQVALQAAANGAKMLAMSQLEGKYMNTAGGRISHRSLWNKWSNEIEAQSKQVPIGTLGNPSTWLNILDYVIGKHTQELLAEPQTYVESAATHIDRKVGESDDKKDDKLNAEEMGAVNKMAKYGTKLTAERYQEIKKKMKFVGDNA